MRPLFVLSALAWATATRGLVVDVREYGGGNGPNGWNILATLVDRPFAVSAWKTRLNVASFRAWNRGEGRYRGSPDFGDSDSKMRYADRSPSGGVSCGLRRGEGETVALFGTLSRAVGAWREAADLVQVSKRRISCESRSGTHPMRSA